MKRSAAWDVALVGVMVALIEVCKQALLFLPNIELTSFWIVLFTLYFGRRICAVIPAFILIEGALFGFGLWWVMYLYAWPLLALLAWLFRRHTSALFWACLSGVFGLSFGLLCSIPYVVIGTVQGSLQAGLLTGFSWWVAGIPWDIAHGVGNYLLMLLLYIPVSRVLQSLFPDTRK